MFGMVLGAIGGGILGGLFGRQKAPDFSEYAAAQRYAADKQFEASELNRKSWEAEQARQRRDYKPYVQHGLDALAKISEGNFDAGAWDAEGRFDPAQLPQWGGYNTELPRFTAPTGKQALEDDPGYQFRLREGLKAVRRHAAATGAGARGGATLKALGRWSQDLASQEYSNAYDRARDRYALDYNRALRERAAEREDYDLRTNRFLSAREVARSDHLTRQDLLNNQYNQLMNRATGIGLSALNRSTGYSQNALGMMSNERTRGAQALGAGRVGAATANLQGQIEANRVRQQNLQNILSGARIGAGFGNSLGTYLSA